MFKSISTNEEQKGKRVTILSLNNLKHQQEIGNPNWQQKYQTANSSHYQPYSNLKDNRVILDKPYLKPNYSNFEYQHFPEKNPFLSNYQQNFNEVKDLKLARNERKSNLIKNSEIFVFFL